MNKNFEMAKVLAPLAGFGLTASSLFYSQVVSMQIKVDELTERLVKLDVDPSIFHTESFRYVLNHIAYADMIVKFIVVISIAFAFVSILFACRGYRADINKTPNK